MAETAVFVCQGQRGKNYRKLLKRRSRHTRRETKAGKELADVRGRRKVFLGEVYDFSDPCWRVRYLEGDGRSGIVTKSNKERSWRQLQLEPVVRESGPSESRRVWGGGTTSRAMKGKELEASA